MDLKRILQEMGHDLVETHGFRAVSLSGSQKLDNTTAPIVEFLIWLDSTPQAREVLRQMGYGPPDAKPQNQPFRVAQ